MTVFTPRDGVFKVQFTIRNYPKRLKSYTGARLVCAVSTFDQGELGWHLLSGTEKSGLQLGTAVGTGSYGIVREAHYRGYKLICHLCLHTSMPVLGVSWLLQYLLLFPSSYDVLERLSLLPVDIREV